MVNYRSSSEAGKIAFAPNDIALSWLPCQGWAQSFTYDPFGNITKNPISNPQSGQITQTYAAGYNGLTNQANSGVTAVYDLNGNQTMAENNSMTWNAAGNAIAVNGVVGTYDAAGRVVETGGSIAAVPATVSVGTISVSGTEQSIPGGTNYQATAMVTITGTIKNQTFTPPLPSNCGYRSGNTCYDAGGGTIAVNVVALSTGQSVAGSTFGISYGQPTDTPASIAAAAAASINSMTGSTGVSATSSGGVVTLTMKAEYTSQVGFQVSGGIGCDGLFSPCSFAEAFSPSGMIVGTQTGTTPTVYDTGTVTAAISNLPVASYSYGSSDTPAMIASGLVAAINKADSSAATAVATTVNGLPGMQVSSKATGYGINWPIVMSTTYNTSSFTKPSFTETATNVAGGYPAVAAVAGSGAYTEFIYSPAGDKIAVVQNGALVKGTVPLPGGASAIYNSAGLKYFRHKDWLGNSRLATTWAHGVYSKTAYAPFGESYDQAGTTDLSFIGENQDTSAGVYDYMFRKLDPIAGRWMSPDPSGLTYADPENPQSLNLYSYVLNNPLVNVDLNGLECVWDDGSFDAADDPDTGSPEGCSGAGGTYVGPDLFENALLINEEYANIQYGSWSGDANSTIASSWIDNSAAASATPVDIPLSDTFSFANMTPDDFIQEMTQAGIPVSPWDTQKNTMHQGTQLRSKDKATCGLHVIIDPNSGKNGAPTSGTFHYDLVNPVSTSDPNNLNRFKATVHGVVDVVPDWIQAHIWSGDVTGNHFCSPNRR